MRHLILLFFVGSSLFFLAGCTSGDTGGEESDNTLPTTKTQSGYPYKFHVDNDGAVIQEGQYAYFHYARRLDDSLLDNSRSIGQKPRLRMPPADQLGAQPNPLIEGLSLMSEGDSITVYIDLDSIPNLPPNLEKFDYMHIDVMLNSIKSVEEYQADIAAEQAEQQAKIEANKARLQEVKQLVSKTLSDYKNGKLDDQLKTTASGLKYLIHEEGTGTQLAAGERVNVNYYGSLLDGTRFDDSFSRGSGFQLVLGSGQVIKGWDEGLALFKRGTKASLFIPSDLGYGERGSPPTIPANAELHFYVEPQ